MIFCNKINPTNHIRNLYPVFLYMSCILMNMYKILQQKKMLIHGKLYTYRHWNLRMMDKFKSNSLKDRGSKVMATHSNVLWVIRLHSIQKEELNLLVLRTVLKGETLRVPCSCFFAVSLMHHGHGQALIRKPHCLIHWVYNNCRTDIAQVIASSELTHVL